MARWIDPWMPGASTAPNGRTADAHRGEKFGLPASGVRSVAGFGRRLAALTVDWLLAYFIAPLFSNPDPRVDPNHGFVVLGIWFLLTAVAVAVTGITPGMYAVGIRVASIRNTAFVGVPRALLRTLLIAVVFPPLFRDDDGRGWHDLAAATIVVRTRA